MCLITDKYNHIIEIFATDKQICINGEYNKQSVFKNIF